MRDEEGSEESAEKKGQDAQNAVCWSPDSQSPDGAEQLYETERSVKVSNFRPKTHQSQPHTTLWPEAPPPGALPERRRRAAERTHSFFLFSIRFYLTAFIFFYFQLWNFYKQHRQDFVHFEND